MNSVNSVDTVYVADVMMERCPHCPSARVWWVSYEVGRPPEFIYEGFPAKGLVILSKETVVVWCEKCSQVKPNLHDQLHSDDRHL